MGVQLFGIGIPISQKGAALGVPVLDAYKTLNQDFLKILTTVSGNIVSDNAGDLVVKHELT